MMNRQAVAVLLASSALLVTSPLAAQAAASIDGNDNGQTASPEMLGGDIVVTATRRAEALQDVPVSVDVVGGEQLKRFSLFDFKDVQGMTPGLQLTNDDGRSNVATLRGITFNPDSGSSPAVDTFFNEVPLDPQTAFTSIYDVGQIEVLRGPQGLFRGRTSPAGSITLTTRRPNMTSPEGYAQLTATSLGGINAQGGASLPLVRDVLAVRVAALVDENRSNHVRNVSGDRSKSSTQSVRLSAQYEPSAEFRANIMYQYLTADIRPYIAVFGPGNQPSLLDPTRSGPAIELNERRSVTEGVPRFQNETHLLTFNAQYHFDTVSLTYNGGYQDTVLSQDRDQDVANAVPNYRQRQFIGTPYRVWSNELRLQSEGDGPFTWFVAGNYLRQNNPVVLDQVADQLLGLSFTPIPPSMGMVPVGVTGNINIRSRQFSVAGSMGYEFTDALSLNVGLRHTWYNTDRTQETTITSPLIGGGIPFTTVTESSLRARYFTGGANLSYKFTDDVSVYASYGRSVRPGVFSVGVAVPLDPEYLSTPDEKSNGYEVGLKTRLFDGAGMLNIAAFYQTFDNYISFESCLTSNSSRIPGIVDVGCTPLATYGDAKAKGFEVQFSARPVEFFDFGINASYADTRYNNAQVFCNDFNGDGKPDSSGTPSVPGTEQVARCDRNDRLAQVPKFNLSANAEVRAPLGAGEGFVRTLITYRPGFDSTVDDYNYRTFTNMSLFLGMRGEDSKWEVSLFAKNLLNQTRALRVSGGVGQIATVDCPSSEHLAQISA